MNDNSPVGIGLPNLLELARSMGWRVSEDHLDGCGGQVVIVDGRRCIVLDDMLPEPERMQCLWRALSRDPRAVLEPFRSQLKQFVARFSEASAANRRRAA